MTVTDELDDGRRVVNPVETAAAQEKAQAMQDRFAEWCWEDPQRAQRLIGEYNRRFNSIVLRVICSPRRAVANVALRLAVASEATVMLGLSST